MDVFFEKQFLKNRQYPNCELCFGERKKQIGLWARMIALRNFRTLTLSYRRVDLDPIISMSVTFFCEYVHLKR